MVFTKSHTIWHTINADHVTSVFYGLAGKLLKIITVLGISGLKHGRKIRLSPKKLEKR